MSSTVTHPPVVDTPKRQQGRKLDPLTAKIQQSSPGSTFALIDVALNQINGLDADIEQLFNDLDFSLPAVTDFTSWNSAVARRTYQVAPMVLIQRKKGFDVLGSGRAWRLAQAVYVPTDIVPALVLSEAKRVPVAEKFELLAAELFGLYAVLRTRPNLPSKLMMVWERLNALGIASIQGSDAKAFARGTGFSLMSLTSRAIITSPRVTNDPVERPNNLADA